MGGKSSKPQCHYPHSSNWGPPPSWGTSPRPSFSGNHFESDMMVQRPIRFARIDDNYHSLDQVTEALAKAGLESSNLIVGIDFTKSNEWTGARSFHHRSLHHISDCPNPYEQAVSIFGRTLSAFDEDNLIPCFGFGDASTHDQDVFSFYPEEKPCNGFEDALQRYRELVPHLKLAGPTSFAPIIETAIGVVDRSHGQYHVLLIITDGQVTRSVDTDLGRLSPQEQNTIEAIVKASEYPLSIVLVGVGDGPWDMMHQFVDNIPSRAFDNFQFVNFTEIIARHISTSKKETEFALAALMELPSQYKATLELRLFGRRIGTQGRISLPPPTRTSGAASFIPKYSQKNHFEHNAGGYNAASAHPSENSQRNIQDVAYEPFVPLTDVEEDCVSDALFGSNRQELLVVHDSSNIEITREVLQCLRPGGWLNDEVINLYLELLKEREKRSPQKFLKCHFFNTFFYKKLINERKHYDYKAVRRWTAQKKIGYSLIDCDKIFVPIDKDKHWCLVVINIKDEKFQYLDSLGDMDSQALRVLARYFIDEVKDKSDRDVNVNSWKQEFVDGLPQQRNGWDCGMFMIKYADFYSRGLTLCFNQDHMPYFRKRTAKEILRLRAQ